MIDDFASRLVDSLAAIFLLLPLELTLYRNDTHACLLRLHEKICVARIFFITGSECAAITSLHEEYQSSVVGTTLHSLYELFYMPRGSIAFGVRKDGHSMLQNTNTRACKYTIRVIA